MTQYGPERLIDLTFNGRGIGASAASEQNEQIVLAFASSCAWQRNLATRGLLIAGRVQVHCPETAMRFRGADH